MNENIPLAVLYSSYLLPKTNALVNLDKYSPKQLQLKIWNKYYESKLLAHKKRNRRKKVIISGILY